jgi:alkaline phosphatase
MENSQGELTRRGLLKTAVFGGAASLFGSAGLTAQAPEKPAAKARGVIFMVSDGMSPGVLTLAESYSKLTRQHGTRWWQLFNDPTSARGLMDTASASSMVTDSAAASSAWGGGKRINNGVINIDPAGHELTPIAALLKRKPQVRIGLVTTATVTHATPAGFAAVVPARGSEALIAPQYLDRVDVILGGGSGFFEAKNRPDKRNLHEDFVNAGYQTVADRDALLAAKTPKLLGTFTAGHLPFEIDRLNDAALAKRIPTLKEMAVAALDRFLAGDQPFLLQIEGARIDHAAHLNDIAALLGDQLAFDDTLGAVLDAIAGRDDILVVVTSDHGNANPGLSGMGTAYGQSTAAFKKILRAKTSHEALFAAWNGQQERDPAKLAAMVANGLGFTLQPAEAEALAAIVGTGHVTEWNHQLEKPEGLLGQLCGNHTGIGWVGTSHTSDPTLVSAIGPQAHRFGGMVVNSDVFGHLVELLG